MRIVGMDILICNGVPENEVEACMEFAFGAKWESVSTHDLDGAWRITNPDRVPICGSMSIREGFAVIAKEYLNG